MSVALDPHHFGDWLGRAALFWPERLAVVDDAKGPSGRFTYAALNDRANRLANWLRDAAGVRSGDRVGVLAPNCVEVLDAFFACGKLGAVLVPLNWRLTPAELAPLIRRTAPRVLLFAGEHRATAATLATGVRLWLHLDGDGIPGSRPYSHALRSPAAPVTNPDAAEEDIACLLFTGGTTGEPKAARISYRMIAWNTLTTLVHELNRDDVTVTHTPMFHTGGLLVYTVPLLTVGGTVVLLRRWDPGRMLELVERERVTMFFCVPTQYRMLLEHERFVRTDFSSVRFVTSGGAPLPLPLMERWRAVHDVPLKQGFGMTEFGPGVFSMGMEHAVAKAGSIGRPNAFVSARLAGDDGRTVAPGEVGELLLKGPAMFSGYLDDPDATAAAVDAGGWLHTGDLARADADGFHFVVDRKQDMFISGGENVYPAEVERALAEHPAVAACAVRGVSDPRWGQTAAAWVVPAGDPNDALSGDGDPAGPPPAVSADDLLDFLRPRLAPYKLPRHIRFVAQLPTSPQGKILRRALRL